MSTLRGALSLPTWLSSAWGLEHSARTGSWDRTVLVGDTVPGFVVAEVAEPRLLTLRGRHRFADYELRFEIDSPLGRAAQLRATSSAAFPGLKGRIYRTVVIASGGHRIAVRRILARVARSVEDG